MKDKMGYHELVDKIIEATGIDNITVFDIEVFKYEWLIVARQLVTGSTYTFWDKDFDTFVAFLENNNDILVGFNIKHYDNPVINAMLNGHDVYTIKEVSDNIVVKGILPYDIEECKRAKSYDSSDLMDDTQLGFSLKGFEAHMGMNIVESTVDFNIDRRLTEEERKEVEEYCINDVQATIELLYQRRNYLGTKIRLGAKKGLRPAESLYMTNAKLTAKYLGAVKKTHTDMYDYVFPENIKYEYIDQGVIDFFKKIKARDIENEDSAKSYKGKIGNCEYKVGVGGIHGCNGVYNMQADEEHLILNVDVNQFYPSMIVENHYLSRNVPNPDDYKAVTLERMKAKKSGDKQTANDLKLVNNTVFGATKNQYNDLYDPLMALSICLSGQLYLLELATHLYTDLDVELIQLNTDGIMLRCKKDQYNAIHVILDEWQERTHFTLEEDNIDLIIQRDVNNYLERQVDGKTKIKGGALVRGISSAGAFKINNNATVIPLAVQNWFFKGIPPEDTINECNDTFCYQIIAKCGSTYKQVYHLRIIDGEAQYIPVQKCNRVFATKNTTMGKLYKQKTENATKEQIASLPDYCKIDNANKITIDEVNKSWYIEEAKKIINDFTQTKKDEGDLITMATKKTNVEPVNLVNPDDFKTWNVYRRLMKARIDFAAKGIKPSGYNGHADFEYLELADIVPTANEVFLGNGIFLMVTFEGENCIGTVVNVDNTDDKIVFTIPHAKIAEPSKFRMNEVQALGGEITYIRRYMYMLVLDIVISDEIDSDKTEEAPVVKAAVKAVAVNEAAKAVAKKESVKAESKPKVTVKGINTPATPTERKEIAKEITDSDGKADKLMIDRAKVLVCEWVKLVPEDKAKATELMVKYDGFTACTKKQIDTIIDTLTAKVAQLKEQANG